MDGRSFTYVCKNKNCLYTTKFLFIKEGYDDTIQDCTIANEEFLEESSVIEGLVELTNIEKATVSSLLSGEAHISGIPELEHTSVVNKKDRHLVDGYYYYYLQNGVVVFGLDKSHEVIKIIDKTASMDDISIAYDEELLANIYTESRAKRRRNKGFKLSNICQITIGNTTYEFKLPQELSKLEVIETNRRLTSEPELLLTQDGWLLILLNKDKTILHRTVNKMHKKKK